MQHPSSELSEEIWTCSRPEDIPLNHQTSSRCKSFLLHFQGAAEPWSNCPNSKNIETFEKLEDGGEGEHQVGSSAIKNTCCCVQKSSWTHEEALTRVGQQTVLQVSVVPDEELSSRVHEEEKTFPGTKTKRGASDPDQNWFSPGSHRRSRTIG